ncbi:MAG: terminase small subunit, partial [Pseudomonadota bacterium]
MTNRNRIDSTAETLRIAAGAKEGVEPPAHVALDETELPFFRSVIAERPAADWQGHDLEAAAMLARAMAGVARMQAALFLEPVTVEGKINPLKQLLAEHRTMVMQLRRSLGLHALGA